MYFFAIMITVLILFVIKNDVQYIYAIFKIPLDDECCQPLLLAPMSSSSSNNLYIVWPDNKTGNWEIFFIKSTDGGNSFSMPLNISNDSSFSGNPSIISYGNHISISWWDNMTGHLSPLIKSSHNNGKSFDKAMILNTTQ
jgi:hypothetical protein